MYQFLLNMWIMARIDEAYLQNQVTRNHITQAQCDMILATPQDPSSLEVNAVVKAE